MKELKQDINFLEFPLWYQAERDVAEFTKIQDGEGYTYTATAGIPSKVDVIFLYYILLECQNRNWSDKLTLSHFNILNGCDISPTKERKARLEESLEKWNGVKLAFSGTFYTKLKYEYLTFRIIDSWGKRERDGKLEIRLSPEWILKIKESNFFKYISFSQMKSVRSPLALRLYEILVKNFKGRNKWEIDCKKLASKIPMTEKYVAHIVPKIESATKRIAEKTDLNVTVTTVKQSRGNGKFIFTVDTKTKPVQQEMFQDDDWKNKSLKNVELLASAGNIHAQKELNRRKRNS